MSFGYRKQPVFNGFNLEIAGGEAVLLTGINGTGKTTLLRLLAGTLLPQSGSIEFSPELGKDPRKKIGFISDRINLYEDMTLSSAIRFHSSVYDISQFDMSLIEKSKLQLNKKIKDLSAGQKLIFHLSLLLSAQPEVLLIDEVIHSIDAYLRDVFLNSLIELMNRRRVTLIMVNLNFHDIEKIPQRVILLKDGSIEVDESIDDLKQKVKKLVSKTEIPGAPVLFSDKYADKYGYYLYPYSETLKTELTQNSDDHVEVENLNLHDIVKAFIGGQYV
jgi:ABC-2 type transport system ATP-binding protein